MQVTWDPAKAGANLQKHGVRFSARRATRKERLPYEEGV